THEPLPIGGPRADSSEKCFAPNRTPKVSPHMSGCMRLSPGASAGTFPEVDHRRFPNRLPSETDTEALPVRAGRRSPEMLPVIRLDNGSSGREVPYLLRSLLHSLPREARL